MYKTIFHFDDKKKAKTLFNNVENLLKDMKEVKEEISVEVLANADAIQIFKKDQKEYEELIKKLIDKKVRIAICQNSLDGQKLKEEDMMENLMIVRSGVGELTRKQSKGWAYIKV